MSDEVDLTGDGGVLKRIIRPAKADAVGPTDSLPVVDVHYEGMLENGEVFDTSRTDNEPFSFEIGSGKVIRAWEFAIKSMKVGELARITCKPDYAYGDKGSPPDIPPRATLTFEVELMACKPHKGSTAMSVEAEKARLSVLRKEREAAAALREDEKKKREEAKAAAAARFQEKANAKKGGGKAKAKGNK